MFVQAFSLFDDDGNGIVDFGEFLVSLYNYCAWARTAAVGSQTKAHAVGAVLLAPTPQAPTRSCR